ncbi:MAG: hypothetical protein JSW61_03325 [Candidatus Thorarchaeota archaeon]|nr:MAG: hypothetical protein JSW61_03325 [Candidatus Thorarchaeota archaeon]
MALEEDYVAVLQAVFMGAGPILFFKTAVFWQGILAGGAAKTKAWIAFSTDPMTIISIVVCLCAMVVFWSFALASGRFGRRDCKS